MSSNEIETLYAIIIIPSNEEVKVHLHSLIISHACPMKIEGSGTVEIYLSGTNSFTAIRNDDIENYNNGHYNPGLACYSIYINIIIDKEEGYDDNSCILILQGTGKNPGLGPAYNHGCNSIEINGGHIEATGGSDLNSRIDENNNNYCYNISGPGIGTTSISANLSAIIIRGGIIIASGGATDGAGIGTGSFGFIETINILGGTIIALGSQFGAAIGTGAGNGKGQSYIYDILISSPAFVKAYAYPKSDGCGAAIGSGYGRYNHSSMIHNIIIFGGTIYANSTQGMGAVIGGGYGNDLNYSSSVENIDIRGGILVIYGSYSSHGIGCGKSRSSSSQTSGILNKLSFTGIDKLYAQNKGKYVLGQEPISGYQEIGEIIYNETLQSLIECDSNIKSICWYPERVDPLTQLNPDPVTDSTYVCDISKGNIVKTFYFTTCNEPPIKLVDSTYIVVGQTTSYQIDLYLNGSLAIYFRNVEINTSKPLYVWGEGTLYLNFLENNIFESNDNPAIYINSGSASIIFNEETREDSNQLHAIVKNGPFSGIGTDRTIKDIIIESGYIEAIGNDGSFSDSNNPNTDGLTTFSSSGAGIGSSTYGIITNIKITGGTVIAKGGTYGTGIGTGLYGDITNIIITNGIVTSYGGKYGAGIGTGYGDRNKDSEYIVATVNLIHISGGTVNAYAIEEGALGAGIGAGGGKGTYSSKVNTIKISGGKVRAEVAANGYGAAIGAGSGYAKKSSYVKNIELTGGDITAIGPYNATGIGYGYGYYESITSDPSSSDYSSNVGTLTITKEVDKLYASSLRINGSLGQSENENNRNVSTCAIDEEFTASLHCLEDNTICQYPDPFPIPALCICQTEASCNPTHGLVCDSYIDSISDAYNSDLQHIYIDKGDAFSIDQSSFDHDVTIVIDSSDASFVLEEDHPIVSYNPIGDDSLLIIDKGSSNAWITESDHFIIFVSDSDISITIKPTPTNTFTKSIFFTPSNEFTKSISFTSSNAFTKSISFTPSIAFTKSISFTPSIAFTKSFSNIFTNSLEIINLNYIFFIYPFYFVYLFNI